MTKGETRGALIVFRRGEREGEGGSTNGRGWGRERGVERRGGEREEGRERGGREGGGGQRERGVSCHSSWGSWTGKLLCDSLGPMVVLVFTGLDGIHAMLHMSQMHVQPQDLGSVLHMRAGGSVRNVYTVHFAVRSTAFGSTPH